MFCYPANFYNGFLRTIYFVIRVPKRGTNRSILLI
jgi:hypothetical protein